MTKIVFSFDDGRKDNYSVAFEVLVKNYISATFNITTDYINGNINEGKLPCTNEALSKDEVLKLASNSHFEIAGHGKKHSNECENLINGVKELRDWLPQKNINGIASPYSQAKVEDLLSHKTEYERNNISYIRLGDRITTFKFLKKILRKVNRMFFHIPFIFTWVHEESFFSEADNFILYSVPILKNDTVDEVLALVKKAVKKDKNLILMFHSILKKGEPEYDSNWTWDWEKFCNLIERLNKMQTSDIIKITTTQDLVLGK